jgi:hypothetical protein
MYRATRDFISTRNKFVDKFEATHIPIVKRIGGGTKHECYKNSTFFMNANSVNGDIGIWSGWLVMPYDKSTNSTLILAHWWNIKKNGEHFDTTPLEDQAEYVQDYALLKFCDQHIGKLKTHIPHSIVFQNDHFYLITDPEKNEMLEVNDLKNETLYKQKWI